MTKKYVGKYEVETGIPHCKKGVKIPTMDLHFLNEGESFFIPESEMNTHCVHSTISYAKKKFLDRVFAVRSAEKNGEKGSRVFRVK